MSAKFGFKKGYKEQYKTLYSQLVALIELENLYHSENFFTKEKHNEYLQQIIKPINSLIEALSISPGEVLNFARATNLETEYLTDILYQGGSEEAKNLDSIGQRLGNNLVIFLNRVHQQFPKSEIKSSWMCVYNCLKVFKTNREITDIVKKIEGVLAKYPEPHQILSKDDTKLLIDYREDLKLEIDTYTFNESSQAKKAFECGIKKQTFFDAVYLQGVADAEQVQISLDEFLYSVNKLSNIKDNADAVNLLNRYKEILNKYKGTPKACLSDEDVEEIMETQTEITEILFGNDE